MPTFGSLYRIRYTVHQIQDFKLPREFTAFQILAALGSFVVVWRVSALLVNGVVAFALGVAAGFVVTRGVARAEERGRAPMVEVWRLISYPFKARYLAGGRPVRSKIARDRVAAITQTERSRGEEVATVLSELSALLSELFSELRPRWRARPRSINDETQEPPETAERGESQP